MLTILAILIAAIVIGGGLWQLTAFIRYIRSGEYETDKRLSDITQ